MKNINKKPGYQHFIRFVLTILILLPAGIYGQYFGRNKVDYESFDFSTMKSSHFKVYFYEEERQAAADAIRMLEQWHNGMRVIFEESLGPDQPIILYANHADFQQTNVTGGIIPQGTGGFTEGLKNRIVLPFTGVNQNDKHVLGHELVHAFQYDYMKRQQRMRSGRSRVPLWMIEGMAEYLSIGRKDPLTAMWMRDAVMNDDLPTISEMSRSAEYFPYRWGHALWVYITSQWTDKIVLPLFAAVSSDGWSRGSEKVLGISSDSLSAMWKRSLKSKYEDQVVNSDDHKANLSAIIKGQGGMNMAPVLSPDGKYLAYLSRRELFTIDLYMANAETGEVIKKLVSSNTDQHFDALRFMNSAGAWSPDAGKFAFVVFKNGDNSIAILDVKRREIEKTIPFDKVDQISDLAWSPDGGRLLFAGSFGGKSDLYIYHINEDKTENITEDGYSEIQPAWSPDGKRIAFATDRGPQTDIDRYIFGRMKIAVMDLETKDIELYYISENTKHINPHFSADGNNLFMVADPDGISNVYRYEIDTGNLYRLTNLVTGVSGLTELSPAMSVAGKNNQIALTVYEQGKYNIYGLDTEATGEQLSTNGYAYDEAVSLPLADRADEGIVQNYLTGDPDILPLDEDPEISDYDASLKLIHIGQTGIGVVADRYGASIGGGVSMFFSDMLGNHLLGVGLQSNGGIKDLGGQVMYQNRKNRYNWGGAVLHIPYRTARSAVRPDTISVNGQTAVARRYELILQRIFIDRLILQAEYPLSKNRRFELGTGYTRYSYDYELEYYTTYAGYSVDQGTEDIDNPEGLNLFQTSLAYVGDYSFFGFTSAVNGRRYRIEVEPTFGSLRYVTLLADYRHYFFLNPVTVAFRGMHLGRYWTDADNQRLSPLYIGYHTYVRGYSLNSLKVSDCRPTSTSRCLIYDQLVGSRIAVFNAELRLPFFGTEQFGLINFPYLPTELSAFFDAGMAWSQNDGVELKFDTDPAEHVPVFSTGLAARVNVLGYIVVQFYYAHAFQRPNDKYQFGFVIAPGW